MKNRWILFVAISLLMFFGFALSGATNFDHLVLGTGNYGTDPNPTADVTLQNDEYITNSVDGTIDFGAADLATSGTATFTSIGAGTLTGSLTATDSTISVILVDDALSGMKWQIRVDSTGALWADSTGLN